MNRGLTYVVVFILIRVNSRGVRRLCQSLRSPNTTTLIKRFGLRGTAKQRARMYVSTPFSRYKQEPSHDVHVDSE